MNRLFPTTRRPLRHSGFTLVEIMVVLAIAALVSGIVFSGFKSMRTGNRRLSCQTNLIAVYRAARLYQADEGAFPYYNPNDTSTPTPQVGIGLWQLYTFSDPAYNPTASADAQARANTIAPPGLDPKIPTSRYLRNITAFHCPSQIKDGTTSLYDGGRLNPNYLSYQVEDPGPDPENPVSAGTWTYDTNRTNDTGHISWKRQLLPFNGTSLAPRPPADDTIVTWCPFHRNEGGGYDNVLFYDGSVDIIKPAELPDGNWQRMPRGVATTP